MSRSRSIRRLFLGRHRARNPAPPQLQLFQLPGEIRNHIYECLIVFSEPVHIFRERKHPGPTDDTPPCSLASALVSLFLTCRQIHREASAIFYSRNTFTLPPALSHAPHQIQTNFLFRCFLDRIGPHNAALLRHLCVPFPVDPSVFVRSPFIYGPLLSFSSPYHDLDGDVAARLEIDRQEHGYLSLIPALAWRCPNLETVELDLRWNGHWLRLLAPYTRTVRVMLGRLDGALRDAFPALKAVTLRLATGPAWPGWHGEMNLKREEWRWVRRALETGPGWRLSLKDGGQEPPPGGDAIWGWPALWHARRPRDGTALVRAPPAMAVLQAEMYVKHWATRAGIKARAKYASAWLRSPGKAARAREEADEWRRWRGAMLEQPTPPNSPLYGVRLWWRLRFATQLRWEWYAGKQRAKGVLLALLPCMHQASRTDV